MRIADTNRSAAAPHGSCRVDREELLARLKRYYQFTRDIRQGICLLNAGQYDQAAAKFAQATDHGFRHPSLAAWLAAAFAGRGDKDKAAKVLGSPSVVPATRVVDIVRRAYATRAAGQLEQAIEILRQAIHENAEAAELHFQLGLLLSEAQRHEEAELRFTQAVNLDANHTDAMVALALCCGVRGAPSAAAKHLQMAQQRRPWDAMVASLLTQAIRAARQLGVAVRPKAAMPEIDASAESVGLAELARVIEKEPDFVDAFLSLPADQLDQDVYVMLLRTLEMALEHQPEQAELLFHCGRVLDRLGDRAGAIDANERAVRINPRFTRALIELAGLYAKTDRTAEAASRLEEAIAAGAEYADVYYRLGSLYRRQGQLPEARTAFQRALSINSHFAAAEEALAAIAG